MTDAHSFRYVHPDIPPGMTIDERRAQGAAAPIEPETPHVLGRRRVGALISGLDWVRHCRDPPTRVR